MTLIKKQQDSLNNLFGYFTFVLRQLATPPTRGSQKTNGPKDQTHALIRLQR